MPAARNTKAAIRAYATANNCTYTAAKRVLDEQWDRAAIEAAVGSFGELAPHQILFARIKTGARRLYGEQLPAVVTDRLAAEYRLIDGLGHTEYVLAVHDIIAWARGRRIAVSPGVGTMPASLVLYCLGVTLVDPMRYDLPVEQFIHDGRDWLTISTDVEWSRARDVFTYASENFGPIDFDVRGSHELEAIGVAAREARVNVTQLLAGNMTETAGAAKVWEVLPSLGGRDSQSISDVADAVSPLNVFKHPDRTVDYMSRRNGDDRRGALTGITDDAGELDIIGAVLDDTYGLILYREQITHLAADVAGFSGYEQEHLVKVIGKKNARGVDDMLGKFVAGATTARSRFQARTAIALFDYIAASQARAYRRSHALGLAQQMFADAFLMVNHPTEYAAATRWPGSQAG